MPSNALGWLFWFIPIVWTSLCTIVFSPLIIYFCSKKTIKYEKDLEILYSMTDKSEEEYRQKINKVNSLITTYKQNKKIKKRIN